MLKPQPSKTSYHHGDLRQSLMDSALVLIKDEGIDKLSLRKLAQAVGVSQTAIYHHFSDKQDLLYALGKAGIEQLTSQIQPVLLNQDQAIQQRLERAVTRYVQFAIQNPELYELMLGRTTWKQPQETAFHHDGRHSFRAYGKLIASLQKQGIITPQADPLRIAQVSWATLHGICRMHNDGLAFKAQDIDEISQYALKLMLIALDLPQSG